MPSQSLIRWIGERAAALDEIENAHAMIGGTERGRRYATQQINYAYVTLLASHFQGFCRDLHSECVDRIITTVPLQLRRMSQFALVWNRSLDRGNANPATLGSDFNRLGFDFWDKLYEFDLRNRRRRESLQEIINWRNAIAHQDFDPVNSGGNATLHLSKVRGWRTTLNALARHMDQVLYNHLLNDLHVVLW